MSVLTFRADLWNGGALQLATCGALRVSVIRTRVIGTHLLLHTLTTAAVIDCLVNSAVLKVAP